MPDKKSDTVRSFNIKILCKHCNLEGEVSSKDWPIRITGAIEIACPRCGTKTVYIGRFGHDVDSIRQLDDLRRSGVSPEKEKDGEQNG